MHRVYGALFCVGDDFGVAFGVSLGVGLGVAFGVGDAGFPGLADADGGACVGAGSLPGLSTTAPSSPTLAP